MPTIPIRILLLSDQLDARRILSEPLLFPELSRVDTDAARSHAKLRTQVVKMLRNLPPERLSARRLGGKVETGRVEIPLRPPRDDVAWRQSAPLRVEFVYWSHGAEAVVAYVPAFEMQVIVADQRQLRSQVEEQVRSALTRWGASSSLRFPVVLARHRPLRVREELLSVDIRTPKQWAKDRESVGPEKSVLEQMATELTKQCLPPVYERDRLVKQLADRVAGPHARSVLLVGPSGVGKTALLYELARTHDTHQLGNRRFWSTSGARLVAGMSGFGMWQQRCDELVREAAETGGVIHLGNLIELLEVGKCVGQEQGIASVLRPAIESGRLLAIAECTAEQLAVVEKQDARLLAALEQLTVPPPSQSQLRSILLSVATSPPPVPLTASRASRRRLRQRHREVPATSIEPEALDILDRLHRRYATYSAAPGRPIRFLQTLLEDGPRDRALTAADVTAAFSRETGLPAFMLDDAAPLDLDAAAGWFTGRVLGQAEPVRLLTQLMATIKSKLARPGRPIASLLFIGPTGVGKTEMAKALAGYLYRDDSRMVRVDMSEYADAASVDRLIGGTWTSSGLLTRKVREQPFGVILLDEFEKAHPRFYDLLLQVLGEGQLTDTAGRLADFRNSVIILTSNLGVETYRSQKLGFGGSETARAACDYFTQQVREFLRPELFNRIDRVVPFVPLDQPTITEIAGRELDKIRRRDGIRFRNVTLEVADAAIAWLAERGYHPRYGARPLKREIEQRVVAALAEQANRYAGDTPLNVHVLRQAERIVLDVCAAPSAPDSAGDASGQPQAEVHQLTGLRRRVQRLEKSTVALRLHNDTYRLEQRLRTARKRGGATNRSAELQQASGRLQTLRDLLARLDWLHARISKAEDETLLDFYNHRHVDVPSLSATIRSGREDLNRLLLDIYLLDVEVHSRVTVAIFGETSSDVASLGQAYETFAEQRDWQLQRYHLKVYRQELDEEEASRGRQTGDGKPAEMLPSRHLKNRRQADDEPHRKVVDAFSIASSGTWHTVPREAIGVALQIHGEIAFPLIEPEQGVHEFKTNNGTSRCLVETVPGRLAQYEPPAGIARRGTFRDHPLRRRYDMPSQVAYDESLQKDLKWSRGAFDSMIHDALQAHLSRKAETLLEN